MKSGWALLLGAGGFLVVCSGCLGMAAPVQIAFYLAAGWVFYLGRVAPQIQVDPASVATGLACLTGLFLGLHYFLGWLYPAIGNAPGSDHPRRWKWRWTASLVTLVVVLFVSGIAAVAISHQTGWLLTSREPLIGTARMSIARIETSNNLKQIGIALHTYHDAQNTFPPGVLTNSQGQLLHGWQTQLLPYVEAGNIPIDMDRPWDDPVNLPHFRTIVKAYQSPGREPRDKSGLALSHFAGNSQVIGGERPVSLRQLEEGETGVDRTILAGEAYGNFKPWGYPQNWRDPGLGVNQSPDGFGNPTRPVSYYLFADGHVENLSTADATKLLQAPRR